MSIFFSKKKISLKFFPFFYKVFLSIQFAYGFFEKYQNFFFESISRIFLMNGLNEHRGAWLREKKISYEYKIHNHSSIEPGYRYSRWQKFHDFGNIRKLSRFFAFSRFKKISVIPEELPKFQEIFE